MRVWVWLAQLAIFFFFSSYLISRQPKRNNDTPANIKINFPISFRTSKFNVFLLLLTRHRQSRCTIFPNRKKKKKKGRPFFFRSTVALLDILPSNRLSQKNKISYSGCVHSVINVATPGVYSIFASLDQEDFAPFLSPIDRVLADKKLRGIQSAGISDIGR